MLVYSEHTNTTETSLYLFIRASLTVIDSKINRACSPKTIIVRQLSHKVYSRLHTYYINIVIYHRQYKDGVVKSMTNVDPII
jgi:hypothetical protein